MANNIELVGQQNSQIPAQIMKLLKPANDEQCFMGRICKSKNYPYEQSVSLEGQEAIDVSNSVHRYLFIDKLSIVNIIEKINENKTEDCIIHGIQEYIYSLIYKFYNHGFTIKYLVDQTGLTEPVLYHCLKRGINLYMADMDKLPPYIADSATNKLMQLMETIKMREQIEQLNTNIEKLCNILGNSKLTDQQS